MSQISIFDGHNEFKFRKPIRLITFFSGYDSQALALKYLGIEFEHWKTCEWAVKSIQALKDLHFANDNTDYSKSLSKEQLIDYLTSKGISANYNKPMTYEQVKRLGEIKSRQIYNNIKVTRNLVNIQQVKGKDLEICNTDKYDYIITYSFPCQDLSKAGKGKGMAKGSGTRSGMLWEVERILDECKELGQMPKVLLMENVPNVIGSSNISNFVEWRDKLENLGYRCYWQVVNAKDYGVPQNRERCFMVSILGDYYYQFPQPIKLDKRLKDLLEENVDEKYYLSDRALQGVINTKFCCSKLENKLPKDGIVPTICARDYKDPKLVEITSGQSQGKRVYDPNGLSVSLCANGGGLGAKTGLYIKPKCLNSKVNGKQPSVQDRIYDTNAISTAITTSFMPSITEESNLKTKLCNELIRSGKVKEKDVIRHNYSTSRMNNMYIQNNQFHDCSPTLDTRCDCLGVVTNYCIRKLTPKECFRLMGVKDEDFENIAKNQSNASLYHLAGDSIVVNVLMAIFKEML